MKLLIVKTTSFGDLLHTLPALSDAWQAVDGLVCDWLVEAPYASIPTWHPAVRRSISVATRGWRRPPWVQHLGAIRHFVHELRRERYDLVIDAQGLMKSALLARLARGPRVGYGRHSIRETPAARLYDRRVEVNEAVHAIDRARALFAAALDYPVPATLDYGLRLADTTATAAPEPYLVFIPGTTWPSKHWPIPYWQALARHACAAGWPVRVLSGSPAEQRAAERIARDIDGVTVQPPGSLDALAGLLAGARATVAVDTGPAHLAAAVGTPGVSLYGATDAARSGTRGPGQVHLQARFDCAPCERRRCQFADYGQVYPDCYASVPPQRVWRTLRDLIQETQQRRT